MQTPGSGRGMLFSLQEKKLMKRLLPLIFTALSISAKAQKIDSIFVNLYTDSLKKGTYNYINVDGLLSNGRYLPLDSSQISFKASAGKFSGNSLWVDYGFNDDKITISVTLKEDPSQHKEFDMYIKRKPDGPLKTEQEILDELKQRKKKRS
jgi:hypothetical protein